MEKLRLLCVRVCVLHRKAWLSKVKDKRLLLFFLSSFVSWAGKPSDAGNRWLRALTDLIPFLCVCVLLETHLISSPGTHRLAGNAAPQS